MSKRTGAKTRTSANEPAPINDSIPASRAASPRKISGMQAKAPQPLPVLTVVEDQDDERPSVQVSLLPGAAAAALAFDEVEHEFWRDQSGVTRASNPPLPRVSLPPEPRPSLLRVVLSKLLFLTIFSAIIGLSAYALSVAYQQDMFEIRTLFGPFQAP
jgi:hypothetical protein